MSVRIAVTHVIARRFVRPVMLGTHWLRLRPAPHALARVTAYSLRVGTKPHFINWTRDAFGNHVARLDLPEPVTGLGIEVDFVATLEDASPFDFLVDGSAMQHPYRHEPQLEKELAPYLDVGTPGPRLAAWLGALDRRPRYVVERLGELTKGVHASFAHEDAARELPDVESALARQAGTAGDLAWLLTLGLRSLGIAARLTTGYRVVTEAGTASACLHAWSEAYVPGAGWIGLDPVAGLFATARHIPLACGSDPLRVHAILGFREWCEETVEETLRARVLVPSAPSWPYAEGERAAMRTLGARVDARLAKAAVDLALGREVAFVATAAAAVPEWTTAALGPSKLETGRALASALCARLLPGALVHETTGERYGGEPSPRWRIVCVARADGRPVWREPARLGSSGADIGAAGRLATVLARMLGVDPRWCLPAHEDPLARRGRLGAGSLLPPSSDDLRDPERRRQVADELSERLGGPAVGVVLPLGWDHEAGGWRSGRWTFRRCRLYLVDGTLPIGLRLPLESLPVTETPPPDVERCDFASRGAFGDFHADAVARLAAAPSGDDAGPAPRTAVCIEPRDGRLRVFLPPFVQAEHYLALVAAVETAAALTGLSVELEGYEPPEDARLRTIVLEPDVGVLRVALPPSATWSEHAAILDTAYALAEAHGLSAERWSADAIREPVGAAAPIVLGGSRPSTSPFLDRPELLRALVTHWQRHPCLSYLFATRFVGPSGAAIRPDEGRDDALHELTIALERIPAGDGVLPWLGDRLLRHLLADATGDMERAEIRVDQLYDPARASRRLGRVVLRSFDTAPVAAMAALESLLVRALVARFACDPRPRSLVRFGRALHDQYLLPTVLWHDLREVLADLAAAGSTFELAWFEPFHDLHFPLLGRAQIGDVALELRLAHEPWPVLAEEVTATGTARFIDSANERLEVRATGLASGRHVLACNGRRVPLRPTALEGEWVAGVRYKRWNPLATLHPTTWPVGELVFDLIDVWTGTAVGGCRFVPSRPTLLGAVASPLPAEDPPHDSGRTARVVPSMPASRSGAPGRFALGGSGVRHMAPPPAELDVGHLLDLTISA